MKGYVDFAVKFENDFCCQFSAIIHQLVKGHACAIHNGNFFRDVDALVTLRLISFLTNAAISPHALFNLLDFTAFIVSHAYKPQ